MFKEIIDTLGLDIEDYSQWEHKSDVFKMHQLRRKIRYACFSMLRGDSENVPKKFQEYFEAQPHFSGWGLFANRWDVEKADPSKTYPRKFSVEEEWDATLRMAVPELPGALSYKQSE